MDTWHPGKYGKKSEKRNTKIGFKQQNKFDSIIRKYIGSQKGSQMPPRLIT